MNIILRLRRNKQKGPCSFEHGSFCLPKKAHAAPGPRLGRRRECKRLFFLLQRSGVNHKSINALPLCLIGDTTSRSAGAVFSQGSRERTASPTANPTQESREAARRQRLRPSPLGEVPPGGGGGYDCTSYFAERLYPCGKALEPSV